MSVPQWWLGTRLSRPLIFRLSAVRARLDGGDESACEMSAVIAERMRTVLEECDVQGWDVVVEIRAPVLLSGFGIGDAQAYARAGPVS